MERQGENGKGEAATGLGIGATLLVGQLYRRKASQLVATLVRLFGADHIDLAESAVQEAFLKACTHWSYSGMPGNPMGWLTTVAKNYLLNRLRRKKWLTDHEEALSTWYPSDTTGQGDDPLHDDLEGPLRMDDQLCLIFLCCHPCLDERSQIALTLKTAGGFSMPEIARAFLSTEAAIRKRLTRARQKIRAARVPFVIPEPEVLPARLDSVLRVLYLIFNEGYSATALKLCDEALWLTSLFLHESFAHFPKLPTIKALLALMLLQSSRIPARVDEEGYLVLLPEQDRSLWDRERIRWGLQYLEASIEGDEVSVYHLEAEIAAYHAWAPSYEAADWGRIVRCYDILLEHSRSPVVALNRAVALGMAVGPEAALCQLHLLAEDPRLRAYHLLPATYATIYRQLDDRPMALHYYRQAYQQAPTTTDKSHLARRIAACAD